MRDTLRERFYTGVQNPENASALFAAAQAVKFLGTHSDGHALAVRVACLHRSHLAVSSLARAPGRLTIRQSVLFRADKVIE